MFKRIFYPAVFIIALLSMSKMPAGIESIAQDNFNRAGVALFPLFLATNVEDEPELLRRSLVEPSDETEEVEKVPALRKLRDKGLEARLRAEITKNPTWASLIRSKRMSIGIVDMSTGLDAKYAALNGQHMMYAASLPKIAVLAAAHDAIENGTLAETAEIRNDMRLMIAKSNNAATTRMIDRIGFAQIEATMTSPDLKLYDPENGGGLWVGKRYASGGKRIPDPIKGISHAATAEQVCRYFYLLANNELISDRSSEKMKRYLVDPELHHKFVNVLDRVAPNAKVYRKSGSWKSFHADVVLVQGPNRNYIMTALIDDPAGEQIIRDLGKVLDRLMTGA
jgi:beta-lactamase class A